MATTRPFAFNSGAALPGMQQYGTLAVGPIEDSIYRYDLDYGSVKWYMGPDEELGYMVAMPDATTNKPKFRRSPFTDAGYIQMANELSDEYGGSGPFSNSADAKAWVDSEDFFTTFTGGTSPSEMPDPLACWTFEEASGTFYDQTDNERDLDTLTSITYQQPGKVGDYSGGFLSANSEADANDTLELSGGTLCVSTWVKFTGTTATDRGVFCQKDSQDGIAFYIDKSGYPKITMWDGGSSINTHPISVINDGNWHHVVYAVSPGSNVLVQIYVDDDLKEETTFGNAWVDPSSFDFTVGGFDTSGSGLRGYLDSVTVFKELLTSDDVSILYNSGSGIKCGMEKITLWNNGDQTIGLGVDGVGFSTLNSEWDMGNSETKSWTQFQENYFYENPYKAPVVKEIVFSTTDLSKLSSFDMTGTNATTALQHCYKVDFSQMTRCADLQLRYCTFPDLDLSTITELGGGIRIYDHPYALTGITFPTTSSEATNIAEVVLEGNTKMDHYNLSGLTKLGGKIETYGCTVLTGVTFPTTLDSGILELGRVNMSNCDLRSLDLSMFTLARSSWYDNVDYQYKFNNNPNLTSVQFPTVNTGNSVRLYFSYVINFQDCSLDQTSVDDLLAKMLTYYTAVAPVGGNCTVLLNNPSSGSNALPSAQGYLDITDLEDLFTDESLTITITLNT